MDVLFSLAILLASVFILYKSSNKVAESAVTLSKFFGISQLAVGFILISVSTSLPELAVAISSSVAHQGGIMMGNVFGSNVADVFLVIGLGAFIFGVKITRAERKDIGLVLLVTSAISAYVLYSATVNYAVLGFVEGVALLAIFAIYVLYVMGRKNPASDGAYKMPSKAEALTAFLWFFASVIGVILSSGWTVDSAVGLATEAGVAKSFIGATIIAIGTSLPELSIDLAALRKKHYGLAIGDALGSTMTNITLVLGAGSILYPVSLNVPIFVGILIFALFANIVLFYFASTQNRLGRNAGIMMFSCYIIFLFVMFGLQAAEAGGVIGTG